jgi:hypothetical protein
MMRGTSTRRDVDANKPSLRARLHALTGLFGQLPEEYRKEAKRFMWRILCRCPEQLPRALGYVLMGFHYYQFTVAEMLPELDKALSKLPDEAAA